MPLECAQIAKALALRELRELDLSCNPIGLDGLCKLLDPQTSVLHQLESLELYSCRIEMPKTKKKSLNKVLLELPNLERLNMSHNNLSNLLHFLSGSSQLLSETLETLILVDIDPERTPDLNAWLLATLP